MILHLLILSVILTITSPSSTSAQANCTRVCRGRKHSVPYPFGFSDGCEIRMDCLVDNGETRVGEYIVQNITRDHILINLPAKCDRKYEEIRIFNNTNFAITSRNGLLLSNCSSTLNNSVVSTSPVEQYSNLQGCDSRINTTMNCYTVDSLDREEFINLKKLDAAGCRTLISSVTVDVNGSISLVTVGFQFLELGWWVRGECSCDENAVCRNVSFEKQTVGYRCNCNEGYAGDGFIAGDGCRRDAFAGRKWLWPVIIALGAAIVIVIMLCLKTKFRWRKKPKYNVNVENFLKTHEFLTPKRSSMVSMSRTRGTPGYIAPELLSRNFGHVSHKSDVYSYGMMVLEMVGGRKNIEVEVDHTSEIYFPHWIYKKIDLDERLGLHGIVSDEENEMARKMVIVGLWCIQTNPLNHPTMTKVLEMLEGDLLSLEIPPKPYLYSPSRFVNSSSTD
ncbi:hypothetical protein L1987_71650 [Smallanthus sonchifolius]|uniref:Uncharacterized protein n=1 Tax=Smallanthus sonchifolius TaxID=185202 RepID=A0ACB9ATU8_9ASTR|nr:hypothetical protein L1987_71650 [Smallanthus sonchifolius]